MEMNRECARWGCGLSGEARGRVSGREAAQGGRTCRGERLPLPLQAGGGSGDVRSPTANK